MFAKKSKPLATDNYTDLISMNTEINGDFNFAGTLKICGKVNGATITGHPQGNSGVIISATGEVRSEKITAENAVIEGKLLAKELRVEQNLRITATAAITGTDLYYRTISIEPGALLTNCRTFHLDHVSSGEEI